MTMLTILQLLSWLRLIPVVLFLLQYRGKLWAPVPIMLRGFAFMAFLRSINSLVLIFQDPRILERLEISPLILWVSLIESTGSLAIAWLLYVIWWRTRKTV